MRLLENHCMLLPKALKMRAIKHTMALITDSIGRTKCAPAQMPWHLRHLNPALLNRQGMCTYPKMENGSELCHWKGQLVDKPTAFLSDQLLDSSTIGPKQLQILSVRQDQSTVNHTN